ncbi:MAG: N4-gp56 family major capsid protein [Clostridia bacterium]|nr:N4-gp56 family major capsid protein [Clostridia bacterium]
MEKVLSLSMFQLFAEMNLQLFAEPNTNTTGSAELSAENKTYYDMTLIDSAGPELIHDQFAQKRDIPKNGGKTIEFRKFSALPKATQPLVEGVTPEGLSLNVTAITSEVSQFGRYIVTSDVLELTSIDNMIVETTKLLGRQAGLTLDTITRNAIIAVRNDHYASKIAEPNIILKSESEMDDTCHLTVHTVKRAVATLKNNNTPKIDGSYIAIIHPYAAYDIMNDPEWIDVSKYAKPENIFEGEIGKIAGVRFIETSEAKITSDGTFYTMLFGANAYATTEITGGGLETIIKPKGSAGTADPLNQRSSIGWKAIKTAEILVPEYMIKILSRNEFSSSAKEN